MGPWNEIHSELYWVNKNDPKGSIPGLGSTDEQFKNWEYSVSNWSKTSQALGLVGSNVSNTNNTSGLNSNIFRIVAPVKFSTIDKASRQTILVSGLSQKAVSVEYFINGESIGKSTESPFVFSYIPKETPSSDFEDELKAVETDSDGKTTESSTVYSIK